MCLSSVIQIKTSLSETELVRVQRSDPEPASSIRLMCEHFQSLHDVECHVTVYAEETRVSWLDGGHVTKASHTSRLLCRDP